jgi:hypothetical protein
LARFQAELGILIIGSKKEKKVAPTGGLSVSEEEERPAAQWPSHPVVGERVGVTPKRYYPATAADASHWTTPPPQNFF